MRPVFTKISWLAIASFFPGSYFKPLKQSRVNFMTLVKEALMKTLAVSALLIVLLAGCQGSLLQIDVDENSRYFRIPVDSKLILHRALVVPSRSDRLYFQKGMVSQFQSVNEYLPY